MGFESILDPVARSYFKNKYLDADAYDEGYDSGVAVGKTQGAQEEYDRFWDAFQLNGTRRSYPYLFAGSGWTDDVFNPKYEIIVTGMASNMFSYSSQITTTKVPITVDTANATYVFAGCTKLETIPAITITGKVGSFSTWFNSCDVLKNIGLTAESVIAGNGLDLHWSALLTHESLMKILHALQDKTGTTGIWTVTLGDANLAKLSEADIAIAEGKGWVLA